MLSKNLLLTDEPTEDRPGPARNAWVAPTAGHSRRLHCARESHKPRRVTGLRSVPRLVSGRSVQVHVQVGTISEVEMDTEGDRKKDLSEKTREEIQDDLDNKRLGSARLD